MPVTLRGAVALLVIEAVGLLILVGLVAYVDWHENPGRLYDRVLLPFEALAVVLAVVLVALGWQLARRRAWARGPVVALELLLVPLGYFFVQRGAAFVGVPMILLALACGALVIAPASRAALGIR